MRQWLFKQLFENWIPFKWIDGNKTEIARWAAFALATLSVVAQFWPEYAPFVDAAQAKAGTILALVGVEIGRWHKEDKTQR